jgi:HSP20 family molecular chaperone IbpA
MSNNNFETKVNVDPNGNNANRGGNDRCQCGEKNTERKRVKIPRADIYQSNDQVFLEVDMPGVSKENVDIQLENNVMTITGKVNPIPTGWTLIHSECALCDYKRSYELSSDVDFEHITAKMEAGVLRITLPKVQTAKARKIAVCA